MMKHVTKCVLAAVMTAAVAVPAMAADSPWNGTWKQNQAKDKLGDTFTISRKANGMYEFSDGSAIHYEYGCDGKEYAGFAGTVVSCTGNDGAGFDLTVKMNGKVLGTQHETLSDGGRTLVDAGQNMRPDGSGSSYEARYVRIGGAGTGVAGTWKSVAAKASAPAEMVIRVKDGMMHWENKQYQVTIDAKLDGTPVVVMGPTIPKGAMGTMKEEGPRKVHYTSMLDGKVFSEGTDTLSADGRTITEEQWVPGKMAEKTVTVYEKQ